jgi:hypothetical protein
MQIISLHRQQTSINLAEAAAADGQRGSSSEGAAEEPTGEETESQTNYVQTVKEVTA